MVACRPRSDPFVVGASTSPSSASSACCSGSLSSCTRRCTGVAVASARLSVRQRARAAPPRRVEVGRQRGGVLEERALDAQRARCRCRACPVPWRSCPSAPARRAEIAPNVSAIVVNRRALVFDTGATTRAASSSSEKKPWMFVAGRRGSPSPTSGGPRAPGSRPIVSLRSAPRPLRASPKPTRFSPAALRASARRTCRAPGRARPGCASGAAAASPPSASVRSERPRSSSTYFRPSAERGRTVTCESAGTAPSLRSSFSVSCAPTVPPGSRTGSIAVDDADAEAAGAHLVARDEVRAVGEVDLELRRRARTAGRCSRCRRGTRRRRPRAR